MTLSDDNKRQRMGTAADVAELFSEVSSRIGTEGWEKVLPQILGSQSRTDVCLSVCGFTEKRGKPQYFKTWNWLERDKFENKAYVETEMANLLLTLNTFLDPQCTCEPGLHGDFGEHCEFHKKIMGH